MVIMAWLRPLPGAAILGNAQTELKCKGGTT
jgi:hypothetical protein